MNKIYLDGDWNLSYFEEYKEMPQTPGALREFSCSRISARVPGNVELDMSRAGLLPKNLFNGDNILALRHYEAYQWWYEKDFVTPDWHATTTTELVFEGLDCFATIWVNDIEAGYAENGLIRHHFNVSEFLNPIGQSNRLTIRLASPVNAVKHLPIEPQANTGLYKYESLWARKPAHCYGWDIMPRAISAGIWRSVFLKENRDTELTDIFIDTLQASDSEATLIANIDFKTELPLRNFTVRVKGECEGSSFFSEKAMFFVNAGFRIKVQSPKLWWPRGYGQANLYNVKIELLHDGEVVSERTMQIGIRTIALDRTDVSTPTKPGRFQFIVNEVPVFCRGANWVPADVFHSRDAERIPQMLALFSDMECNMLRCWGGNVYETHQFYDICDREGILVWQDFGLACAAYPQHSDFLEIMKKEAEWVVKELRNHPSIALWCGDNECDQVITIWHLTYKDRQRDPNANRITREIFPEVVRLHDPSRPYLPSSPYFPPNIGTNKHDVASSGSDWRAEYIATRNILPEVHIYPEQAKNDVHHFANAAFVSEVGYLSAPCLESMKKFLTPDNLWPLNNNEAVIHSTDSVQYYPENNFRLDKITKAIKAFFGFIPDNLDDFIVASQFVQAEELKFTIEMLRKKKGKTSGFLWWNMIDGWPQFSDAVVDYYFNKKLAYYYLKRVHASLSVIIGEPENNEMIVVTVNDSLKTRSGKIVIRNADNSIVIYENDFSVPPNSAMTCGRIPIPASAQILYLVEWQENDGQKGGSHYLYGEPPFDFNIYKKQWLPLIAAIDNSFTADKVGL